MAVPANCFTISLEPETAPEELFPVPEKRRFDINARTVKINRHPGLLH